MPLVGVLAGLWVSTCVKPRPLEEIILSAYPESLQFIERGPVCRPFVDPVLNFGPDILVWTVRNVLGRRVTESTTSHSVRTRKEGKEGYLGAL